MINLGSFLASHKSKIFLAMRGTAAPLQTPKTEGGTSTFWQPPDVSFDHFLNNISQTKQVLGAYIRHFFTI
jgi:hypothetical protein